MSKGPVFVLGPERSGANLLAWSLGQHPALAASMSTTWLAPFLADLDRAFDQAAADDRSQLAGRGVTRAEFHRAFGEAALHLLTGDRRGAGGVRLVDPTPGHAFEVFALRWLFRDALFIHVVRDASAVVRLLLDKDISKLFRGYHREHKAYEHWVSTVRAGLAAERALGSGTVLRVLHRDLVAEPEQTLRRCLDFVGEEWDPVCLRPLDGVTADVDPPGEGEDESAAPVALPFREEAEALSRALLDAPPPCYPPDPALIEDLERAALEQPSHPPSPSDIRTLVARVKDTMETVLPAGSRALVVSRGDDRLLDVDGRSAGHFPQGDDGHYLGYHPADSADAIARLEALRRGGAQFLVIPSTAFWWLDHYREFQRHLDERYRLVTHRPDVCVVYALDPVAASGPDALALALERVDAAMAPSGRSPR
ncbi:MAG TPA: sulfotransferase [Acidimicrobiales bacterium]|nr:sulfotransferase [Acidimicrobiales bacterium]